MGIEIDMLKVGDADAIVLRYVYPNDQTFVTVIDGAYQDDAQKIVDLIKAHYRRNYIDLMVSTHPDTDHISGLTALLELMQVNKVWVHDPSKHPSSATLAVNRLKAYLRSPSVAILKSMSDLEEFTKAVDNKGIAREEPFAGMQWGPIEVLGPSRAFYEQMLQEIAADEGFSKSARLEQEEDIDPNADYAIDENNVTTPNNNTSTVLRVKDDGRSFLLTADAGVQAFVSASKNYDFSNLYWLQVPHHGSRRNLSTAVCEYLKPTIACVSAEGNIKHPSKAAVNALKHVKTRVFSTHKAGNLWQHQGYGVPDSRPGYVSAEPL